MFNFQNFLIQLTVFMVLGSNIFAQDFGKYGVNTQNNTPIGINVGERAPSFSGENQNNDLVILSEVLEQEKVVLIFYRGYWCPVCNRYLKRYQDSLQLIKAKGARVIAITPETSENMTTTIKNVKAKFDVIADKNNRIIDSYNVGFDVTDEYAKMIEVKLNANIAEANNQERAYLPIPATFIINQQGIIEYAQFDLNYNNRANISEILENL